MSQSVVVEAVVSAGTRYVVFRARTEAEQSVRMWAPTRVIGRAPEPGETWRISGTFREYRGDEPWSGRHVIKRQVMVDEAELERPSGRLLIDVMAHSQRFPGIGVVRARRLWKALGDRMLDVLDAGDPAPFVELLGEDLAKTLVEGWRGLNTDARTFRWLQRNGFDVRLTRKILVVYSAMPVPPEHAAEAERVGAVVWHLEHDPYRMLAFANWNSVDQAARNMGLPEDDPRRLAGAVEAVLIARLGRGDTWMSSADGASAVSALLKSGDQAIGPTAVQAAVERHAVIQHADGLQLPGAWIMERFVEARCEELVASRAALRQLRLASVQTRSDMDAWLDRHERARGPVGVRLLPEQRDALWMAFVEPLSLLLGSPGVGKTTILRTLGDLIEASGGRVIQAALAGRAARRMAQATRRPASTIASLLHRLDTGRVQVDDRDLVIIDEASMVDLALGYRLLRRIEGARLLLVGDPGQLPPIAAGLLLHVLVDQPLVSDEIVPRTILTRVMRQTEISGIPAVCAAIRDGQVPTFAEADAATGVSFIDARPADMTDMVIDQVARLGGAKRVQVIGIVKRDSGGINEINERMHAIATVGRRACGHGFYVGDPVIMTETKHELGVNNGEMGRVVGSSADGLWVYFGEPGEVKIPADEIDGAVQLAYAITCHRAQGSQFPVVVVAIRSKAMLDRTLLLTAVSRAEKRVVILGDRAAFTAAVLAPPAPSLRRVGFGRPR